MKECAIQDIPNLDKLSCHADLRDIIPRMRQATQGANIQFVLMHIYTSLFLQMRVQIRASFLCSTRSSTKKDIILQQKTVTSVNNATVL